MLNKFVVFSVATLVFSWLCWLPIIDRLGDSPFDAAAWVLCLFFLGAYGPTLMGILLSYVFSGSTGLKSLLARAIAVKVGWWPLLLCLLMGPLLYTLAVLFYLALGETLGSVNWGLLPWIPIVFIVPVIFGPLAEEFGWRGFALPLLQPQTHFFRASVILGLVWALWHAPLFWAQTGTAISGFPVTLNQVALFFAAVLGSSFIYTALFNRTDGSLFVAIFLHLSMNASGTIVSMLYPDLSLEQKLLMYQCYTLGLWILLAIWAMFALLRNKNSS